jgi:hypothetical protein
MTPECYLGCGRIVTMIANLIAEIDVAIAQLEQARTLLSGAALPVAKKRGRPAGVVKAAAKPTKATVDEPVKKKRKLSPEGRARIAAAAKARWATVAAAKK